MPIGSNHCAGCGYEFVKVGDQDDCCCDSGTEEDGSHNEGYCRECCPNRHARYSCARYSWPTFERMDCDQ